MAKLNVVNVVEAVAAEVTVKQADGAVVKYRKVDRAAEAGDIVQITDAEVSCITDGGFYEVDEVDSFGDAQVTDDDGDEFDTCGCELEVYEKVAEPKSEVPSDIITHEGRQYRKVARKAAVGELVVRTSGGGINYLEGCVYRADYVSDEGPIRKEGSDTWLWSCNYAVLEPVKSELPSLPSEYVIHGGQVYRKEARVAAEGETIIVVNFDADDHLPSNPAKDDYVYENVRIDSTGDVLIDSEHYVYKREYNALVPAESVTIDEEFTVEKRTAAVSDRILIVNEWPGETRYGIGAIGTVTGRPLSGVGRADIGGKEVTVSDSEYVVLVPKPTYKPGETVWRKYTKSPITLKERCPEFDGSSYGLAWRTSAGSGWLGENQFEKYEEPKPQPAAPKPEPARIAVGSTVRITTDSERLPKDAIAKVTAADRSSWPYKCELLNGDGYDWYKPEQLEVLSDEEAKWAAIGRAVAEYKAGDVVEVIANTNSSVNEIGAFGIITEGRRSSTGSYRVDAGYGDTSNWTKLSDMRLIVPVEQRFDADVKGGGASSK
ncbi:hypothetical protein M6D81_11385 [Paenibacillus sp. J5C_2022]|uniref:hypothetical protein n=1 Tax=Paenibacillus sp. J5C2022 TaxID=2977129 RepID=UPI0021D137B1|nr:hypothetical protein [Paenibacillus sp. J5C2022]MCU6709309.1 hypothetical protein [Paenibacillus sp. J5C2022]